MKTHRELTAIIEGEGDGYVALCPEVDAALELFFETASPAELGERLHDEVLVTRVKVAV